MSVNYSLSTSVKWINNLEKEIKYISFYLRAYNAVDDTVTCEIRDSSVYELKATGPFKKGTDNTSSKENAWYNDDIVRAELYRVKIIYMDETEEEFYCDDMGEGWY